jgi:hypothetical protein
VPAQKAIACMYPERYLPTSTSFWFSSSHSRQPSTINHQPAALVIQYHQTVQHIYMICRASGRLPNKVSAPTGTATKAIHPHNPQYGQLAVSQMVHLHKAHSGPQNKRRDNSNHHHHHHHHRDHHNRVSLASNNSNLPSTQNYPPSAEGTFHCPAATQQCCRPTPLSEAGCSRPHFPSTTSQLSWTNQPWP